MKHKSYRGIKYGAIIATGILLMTLPMTAMAEKNPEGFASAAEVEKKTETKITAEHNAADENATETEITAEKKELTTEKLTTEAVEEETKEEKTAEAVTEEETKTEETKTAEDESKAEDMNAEETAGENTAATDEIGAESDAEAETEAETETETEVEVETKSAELETTAELDSLIIGTWSADEETSLYFGENNKGKLILTDEDYAFSYKIEGDQLSLDFVSSKASDGTYTASVSGDTLTLIGGKGTIGGTFELGKSM